MRRKVKPVIDRITVTAYGDDYTPIGSIVYTNRTRRSALDKALASFPNAKQVSITKEETLAGIEWTASSGFDYTFTDVSEGNP